MSVADKPWRETRIGALVIAVALVSLGVGLSLGAFALSSTLGAATTVVAIAPFVIAVRLLVRAFRRQIWALAVLAVALFSVLGIAALMAPYLAGWDPTGEAVDTHAAPVPRIATGEHALPSGDPGIPGIYAAFVEAAGTFSRSNGDDQLDLAFVEGHVTPDGYFATEVVITQTRHRMPWEGTQYRRVIHRCSGSASFVDGGWTLSFSDARCAHANGRYPRRGDPQGPVLR